MAGKRTFFSSGAIDIRDLSVGAGGLCSFFRNEMYFTQLRNREMKNTLPMMPVSVVLLFSVKPSMGALELLFSILSKPPENFPLLSTKMRQFSN